MGILLTKTLVSQRKVIQEAGLKLKKNWISVYYSVPIVTESFMQQAQLLRETAVETAGELLEAQ